MSHFIFKAKKPDGQVYSGQADAADRFELYRIIRESGDEVVTFHEKNTSFLSTIVSWFSFIFSPIKVIDKIHLVRNLGSMLEAGLSLARSLSVLEKQIKNRRLKGILNNILTDITSGSTFADALSKYPKVFSQLVISMVHTGEQSGTLAESLKVVASQMDSAYALEKRVRGALIYPGVILFLMLIIGILMFIFVVPTLTKTFTELNVKLPASTQFVLSFSDLLKNHGLIVLIIFIIFSALISFWLHKPSGKNFFHYLVLKIPVVGPLVQEVNAARTSRTLSSLLGAGVDVVQSVNITAQVVQNVHFRAVLKRAVEAIKVGKPMSKIFSEDSKLYPLFMSEMINVGEETGKMKDMLMGVAEYYEDDVQQKTKDMSTIIEPALMIVIGGAVGFFAISMISPMYSLASAI